MYFLLYFRIFNIFSNNLLPPLFIIAPPSSPSLASLLVCVAMGAPGAPPPRRSFFRSSAHATRLDCLCAIATVAVECDRAVIPCALTVFALNLLPLHHGAKTTDPLLWDRSHHNLPPCPSSSFESTNNARVKRKGSRKNGKEKQNSKHTLTTYTHTYIHTRVHTRNTRNKYNCLCAVWTP